MISQVNRYIMRQFLYLNLMRMQFHLMRLHFLFDMQEDVIDQLFYLIFLSLLIVIHLCIDMNYLALIGIFVFIHYSQLKKPLGKNHRLNESQGYYLIQSHYM